MPAISILSLKVPFIYNRTFTSHMRNNMIHPSKYRHPPTTTSDFEEIGVVTDAILSTSHYSMEQIAKGIQKYGLHDCRISRKVERIWFYTTPDSKISHICEIGPVTLAPSSRDRANLPNPLKNPVPTRNGYGFGYEILEVYELNTPITLEHLKDKYSMAKGPEAMVDDVPTGLVYVLPEIIAETPLLQQKRIL
jgi:hypothetical protein